MARQALILAAAFALAASLSLAGTPPAGAAACPADVDLSGLVAALDEMAGRLPGLDGQAAKDAAEALRARSDEREGLCRTLQAQTRQIEALGASLALERGLLAACQTGRSACYTEWEAAIRRPRTGSTGRLGWVIGGCGLWRVVGDPNDDIALGAGACWGIRP